MQRGSLAHESTKSVSDVAIFHHRILTVGIGASISNDISAGKLDPIMMETVGRLNIPYIMMHMRGTPKTMQNKTNYKNIAGT